MYIYIYIYIYIFMGLGLFGVVFLALDYLAYLLWHETIWRIITNVLFGIGLFGALTYGLFWHWSIWRVCPYAMFFLKKPLCVFFFFS